MSLPRDAVRNRREQRQGTRTFDWPEYLVTARHSVFQAAGDEPARVPQAQWHARQVGSLHTACGQSAVTWPIFWMLEFAAAGAAACPECLTVVNVA